MAQTGRPKKVLDWEQIDELAKIHCTHEEIASVMGCCVETLARACQDEHGRSFSDYYEEKRDSGRASLRRVQWKLAESGDKTMNVWLGKQWLDQKDTHHVESNNVTTIKKSVEEMDNDELHGKIAALEQELDDGSSSGE